METLPPVFQMRSGLMSGTITVDYFRKPRLLTESTLSYVALEVCGRIKSNSTRMCSVQDLGGLVLFMAIKGTYSPCLLFCNAG